MARETKRMPIEDMPDEFLKEQRDEVDFDALIEKAIHVENTDDEETDNHPPSKDDR